MKILIANDGPHAFYFIRLGLARAFMACGHEVNMWNMNQISAYDIFDTFQPDLFIGQTYNTSEAIVELIKERPHMKVIMKAGDWGPLIDNIEFPILKASQQEIDTITALYEETGKPDFLNIHHHVDWLEQTHGYWQDHGVPIESVLSAADIYDYTKGVYKPEYDCDIMFVGGYWGYKAQTFDRWLLPLCKKWKYRIKIFGNSPWPIPQYCGFINNDEVKHAMKSAKICINLSEPHSQVYGYDIIERPFKILANGCFMISDHVTGLEKILGGSFRSATTPEEFEYEIDYWINKSSERWPFGMLGQQSVLESHTYFQRIIQIFDKLNLTNHAEHAKAVYNNIKGQICPES
jgi:hypothetical protein